MNGSLLCFKRRRRIITFCKCVKSSLKLLIYFGVFRNLRDVLGLSDELTVESCDSISQII